MRRTSDSVDLSASGGFIRLRRIDAEIAVKGHFWLVRRRDHESTFIVRPEDGGLGTA